jgi:hypothetical protein
MRATRIAGAIAFALGAGLAGAAHAQAVPVVRFDEILAPDRPEAWAMQYVAAATLPAGYSPCPALAPGAWELAGELAQMPSIDEDRRRVGFEGTKVENLNTAPVFGRLRGALGLPGRWRLEAGWTPPVTLDGARPQELVSLAVGKRWLVGEAWSLDARAFGQHGSIGGDFTCPAELAGVADPDANPFGCEAPSSDRFRVRQYGLEGAFAWTRQAWRLHASAGAVRNELVVDVDAFVYGVHDRSQLVIHDTRPFLALGASRDLGAHWRLEANWLHVPLSVRREGEREDDAFGALRAALAWRPR